MPQHRRRAADLHLYFAAQRGGGCRARTLLRNMLRITYSAPIDYYHLLPQAVRQSLRNLSRREIGAASSPGGDDAYGLTKCL